MIKKILITFLVLSFCLSFTVSALSGLKFETADEFISFVDDAQKVSEIFKSDANDITEYCKKEGIEFLAVNEENTKQIRITAKQNDFTNSVINISALSNDKINSLLPDILGDSNIKGEILEKNGQKFIRTDIMSSDSGGKYQITEYITVADKKSIVLSFYTAEGVDNGYIEPCFESFDFNGFRNDKKEKKLTIWQYVLPVVIVVFSVAFLVVAITVIVDLKRKDKKIQEIEQDIE